MYGCMDVWMYMYVCNIPVCPIFWGAPYIPWFIIIFPIVYYAYDNLDLYDTRHEREYEY